MIGYMYLYNQAPDRARVALQMNRTAIAQHCIGRPLGERVPDGSAGGGGGRLWTRADVSHRTSVTMHHSVANFSAVAAFRLFLSSPRSNTTTIYKIAGAISLYHLYLYIASNIEHHCSDTRQRLLIFTIEYRCFHFSNRRPTGCHCVSRYSGVRSRRSIEQLSIILTLNK